MAPWIVSSGLHRELGYTCYPSAKSTAVVEKGCEDTDRVLACRTGAFHNLRTGQYTGFAFSPSQRPLNGRFDTDKTTCKRRSSQGVK